jgi:hypothetical protein
MNLAAWDALAAVRQDASADGFRELLRPDADVEISAGLVLAGPEPDALTSGG